MREEYLLSIFGRPCGLDKPTCLRFPSRAVICLVSVYLPLLCRTVCDNIHNHFPFEDRTTATLPSSFSTLLRSYRGDGTTYLGPAAAASAAVSSLAARKRPCGPILLRSRRFEPLEPPVNVQAVPRRPQHLQSQGQQDARRALNYGIEAEQGGNSTTGTRAKDF